MVAVDVEPQYSLVAVPMDQARTQMAYLVANRCPYLLHHEEGRVATSPPSFRLSYLLPAFFADACTLAGGAYFLQSGFEQRSCSTHEQADSLISIPEVTGRFFCAPTAAASPLFADSLILGRQNRGRGFQSESFGKQQQCRTLFGVIAMSINRPEQERLRPEVGSVARLWLCR